MVLILRNGEWHFDEQLLLHIRKKDNNEVRSILRSDDLCKLTDSQRSTLLHFASEYGNANIARHLIDSGVDVNSEDDLGRTPLLLAVTRDQAEISFETINVLLQAKADFLKADVRGRYPLQRVVDSKTFGKLSIVKKFFQRLIDYCANDLKLMAELLIKAECPLERAIHVGNSSVTEAMIQAGCPVDEVHPRLGHTALHVATTIMDLENVKALMKHGANVTARIRGRLLPLSLYFIAGKTNRAHMQNPEIMKLLMSQYFRARDKAEDVALSVKHAFQLGDEEAIRHMLLYDEVDFSRRGRHDSSPLHYLAMNDNPNVAATAFETRMADVNARNSRGCTPLHYAVVARNVSNVRVFLDNGASVNERSLIGNTPLSALFFTLSTEPFYESLEEQIVEMLLRHGSDVQVVIPHTGDTMFDQLVRHERFDLSQLLMVNLVYREQLGEPIIHSIRGQIDRQPILKKQYDLCRGKLDEMKSFEIYESITLFKLLCQSEKEMVRCYVYNEELLKELENFSTKYYWFTYCYHKILRDRLAGALPKIKLVRNVTNVIFDLLGPQLKRNYLVVRRIIDYLSYEDMQVLNEIKIH